MSDVLHSDHHHLSNHQHKLSADHCAHERHSAEHALRKDCGHDSKHFHYLSSGTPMLLHALKITDFEHDKSVLLNARLSRSERLAAAHELVENHVKKIDFTDRLGHHRQLHLGVSPADGRLRVTENSSVILEDNMGHSFTNHLRAPGHVAGLHYPSHHFSGVGTYHRPEGGRTIHSPFVDPRYYQLQENPDGSKTLEFNGCAVDTDGASRHAEDRCWQSHTSLRLSDGESLNTDLDNFMVLSPSLAKACGVRLGDCGYLVDKSTGRAVPVVFGDSGPEGKRSAEASVHALKQLGRNERIDGNHGLEGKFEVVVVPKSGNGTGDLARNPDAIKKVLDARTEAAQVART